MLKSNFRNILLYIFLKYLIFYIFMMFRNNNFYLVDPGIRDVADLFYYLWIFLSLPVFISVLFSFPIYYSFRMKKTIYFVLINILVLIAEYFIYTCFASQLNSWNGIYNTIIGIVLLGIFFYKPIRSKFTGS